MVNFLKRVMKIWFLSFTANIGQKKEEVEEKEYITEREEWDGDKYVKRKIITKTKLIKGRIILGHFSGFLCPLYRFDVDWSPILCLALVTDAIG
jgi:hypothetical protein